MKPLYPIIALLTVPVLSVAQPLALAAGNDTARLVELKEVTISTSGLNPQQRLVRYFRANRAATLEDILARLPETGLVRRGPFGTEPLIRSFSGGQINVLVDGMRIHGACTDKMDPATIYIEPVNLDQLQVQTGGQGFQYGSAIGGTVNAKLAEPEFDTKRKTSGTVSSGWQSAARSVYESARLNYTDGPWAVRVSGVYRHSQDYRSGGGARIAFSQYEKANLALSVKYRLGGRSWLKADWLYDRGWNIGYPSLPMDVGQATAQIGSLTWQTERNGKRFNKLLVKVYTNGVKHAMDDTHRPYTGMHMDMPGRSATNGLYGEAEIRLPKKQRLFLRSDLSTTRLKAEMTMMQAGQPDMYMLTWPDNRKLQGGISASWLLPLDSNWKLQATTRGDYIRNSLLTTQAKDQVAIFGYPDAGRKDLLLNAAIQVTRVLSKFTRVNLGLSFSERAPTASELYGFYLFNASDGFDYIGNPRLKNEKALQAEIGWQYMKNQCRLQFTGFISRINDHIGPRLEQGFLPMTIGARGTRTYVNNAHALLAGGEASTSWKPCRTLEMVSTLRYTYGRDRQALPLPGIAPLKETNSLRWQLNKWFVQGETEWAAAQHRYSTVAGEDRSAGFFLCHTRTGFQTSFAGLGLDCQFGIENVFDKKYHEHLDWGNIPRPGRNGYVMVGVRF